MRSVLAAGILMMVVGHVMAGGARGAIVFGQLDDFQGGTPMDWVEGGPSYNPPFNTADGRGGAADLYLRNISSTSEREGSRMIMFNQAQWAGDYAAAGVTRVDAWMANFGSSQLRMRMAIESTAGTKWVSAAAVSLPANSGWRRVTFDLTAAGMRRLVGGQTLGEALSSVRAARLLSAASPAWEGDEMNGTLGVDDVRALGLPGDADFDGRVNAADLLALRRNLGSAAAGGAEGWRSGDFNFDGRVDGRDAVLLRDNLGRSVAPPALAVNVVPEPTGAAALAVAALALWSRRRWW